MTITIRLLQETEWKWTLKRDNTRKWMIFMNGEMTTSKLDAKHKC
jgi:hypothetical protein